MRTLRNLGMSAKVLLLACVCSFGLLLYGFVSYWVVNSSKIGSKHFDDIIESEHLMADVLPPPGYILETYLNIHLMIDSTEAGTEALTDRINAHFNLKKQHQECMDRWAAKLPEGELRNKLLKESYEPAKEFYLLVENEIIPAIRRGDMEKAESLIDDELPKHFEKHRKAMDEVNRLVAGFEDEKMAEAKSVVSTGSWLQLVIGVSVLLAIGGFTYWLRSGIAVQEAKMVDYANQVAAAGRSQAVIEFDPQGNILTANDNFLAAMGYELSEIVGRHHRNFVPEALRNSNEYAEFWPALARGEFKSGEFHRINKAGKDIWIYATYNPIRDNTGKVIKIVKFASDITARKLQDADFVGQIQAISSAQAVIEFDLTGKILTANENFCKTVGYTLDEIKGKHHSMFCDPLYRQSAEYVNFWQKLGSGQYDAGEYKRIGKGGREIYLQASYNPIFDLNGKPYKVVKYASDTTQIVRERESLKNKVDQILAVVSAAAQGDLTQTISVSGTDPVGQLGDSLTKFFETLSVSIASIGENATALAGASEELSAVSSQMSANATETASQAQFVSSATDEVNANVSVVATGVEELNSAIREIAKNASDAARVSQQAVTIASDTNRTISKLGDSSMEIGKVVKVITSIAEQTNLLALNATIEAARAGEAGKGFAVVANEVKELAKETARATEDISHKIETIQADTNGAISAIQEICEVINRINDISNTIASAVEEQTATANEMGRNVSEAARGSAEIAQNITSVADATRSTTEGANNSMQAASELSRMAGDLQRLVGQFKYHRDALNSRRSVLNPTVQMTSFAVPQTV